jgi:P-type Ca2+ transporter type 2C
LRDIVDTVIIGLVVVLNTTVGVVQELRVGHTIRAVRAAGQCTQTRRQIR